MKRLDDICGILSNRLMKIKSHSDYLVNIMEECAHTMSFLPAFMVKQRLVSIGEEILNCSSSLLAEHNGKGWVFVIMSDSLLVVHWIESEYSPNVKEYFKKRNLNTFTLSEIMELIAQLSNKVDSGQFAEAVDWVNRYEPSFTKGGANN